MRLRPGPTIRSVGSRFQPREVLAMSGPRALSWRSLGEADLPDLTELAQACLAADGGQPFAATPGFLRGRYLSGAETYAGYTGGRLICVTSLRRSAAGTSSDESDDPPVTTGLVHPQWRRRGIGAHALDWASKRAAADRLLAETEALGDGAHAVYLSNGLVQVFAEDVMQLAASTTPPLAIAPHGMTLAEWGQADPGRFHAVYAA